MSFEDPFPAFLDETAYPGEALKGSSLSFSFQHSKYEGRPPVLGLELGILDFPGSAAGIVAFLSISIGWPRG
jgi:hypothetical protein